VQFFLEHPVYRTNHRPLKLRSLWY